MYGISGKKFFFQNFNTFFCFVSDLNVIFGFRTPKVLKVPIFIKIQWTKLKIWTKIHYRKFTRWPLRGQKRRTVVQTFNCNISETIWDRSLKFGLYLSSRYVYTYARNLIEIWVGFRHVALWCGILQFSKKSKSYEISNTEIYIGEDPEFIICVFY